MFISCFHQCCENQLSMRLHWCLQWSGESRRIKARRVIQGSLLLLSVWVSMCCLDRCRASTSSSPNGMLRRVTAKSVDNIKRSKGIMLHQRWEHQTGGTKIKSRVLSSNDSFFRVSFDVLGDDDSSCRTTTTTRVQKYRYIASQGNRKR